MDNSSVADRAPEAWERVRSLVGVPRGPAYVDDTTWSHRVVSLESSAQLDILVAADTLRQGDEAQQGLARACYALLEAHLDPCRESDIARIRWAALDAWIPSVRFEPLVRRAVATASDPVLRMESRLALGSLVEEAGDEEGAEQYYRQALAASRGSRGNTEVMAILRLARLYRRQHRVFEALVLCRRVATLMGSMGDDWGLFMALVNRCGVLMRVGDVERAGRTLCDAEAASESLEGAELAMARASLNTHRSAILLARGDPAGALQELDKRDELAPDGMPNDDPRRRMILRAAVLREAGRFAEARVLLEEARRGRDPLDPVRLEGLEQTILLEIAGSGVDDARPWITQLFDALADARVRELWPSFRVALGLRVGRELQRHRGTFGDARHAFDLAATAGIERIGQLSRCVSQLPELTTAEPEDLEILATYRDQFEDEQSEIIDAVARAFEVAVMRGEASLDELSVKPGMITVCAWCERINTVRGTWLPVRQYVPSTGCQQLTHGVCPDCRARILHSHGLD